MLGIDGARGVTCVWATVFVLLVAGGACGSNSEEAAGPEDVSPNPGADTRPDGTAADDSGGAPSPDVTPDGAGATDVGRDTADVLETPWPWPTCPTWAEGAMTLHEKAHALDVLVRMRHVDDGLIRTIRLDDRDRVTAREHLPSTGLWTAMYLASQSFRYAVTGETEARENAWAAAEGLHDLTAVTGVPGLYGRAYQRPDFDYTSDAAGASGWVESPAPDYAGWWWNADVSKDTMDGIMFGYAVALEIANDEYLSSVVEQDLLAFVRSLVDNGLQIIDHHGAVTEHGRLYYSALDDFFGFNALLSSSWVKVAADTGDAPLNRFYENCLMRAGDRTGCPDLDVLDLGSYLDVIETALFLYRPRCKTSYDNIDMVFHAIYPLLRRETDPDRRARLLAVLDRGIWEPVEENSDPPLHRSEHSLYIFLYGALADPSQDDPVFLAAVEDAVCTLYRLPLDRKDKTVAAGTQEGVCTNRMGRPNAAEVVPLEERSYDNYMWRLDPYEIPEAYEGVPDRVHSPEDFLLAYWIGRYFGYVSEDM